MEPINYTVYIYQVFISYKLKKNFFFFLNERTCRDDTLMLPWLDCMSSCHASTAKKGITFSVVALEVLHAPTYMYLKPCGGIFGLV